MTELLCSRMLTSLSGQSYGTALGATAAAMFPDRVDKVALDGAYRHPLKLLNIC